MKKQKLVLKKETISKLTNTQEIRGGITPGGIVPFIIKKTGTMERVYGYVERLFGGDKPPVSVPCTLVYTNCGTCFKR